MVRKKCRRQIFFQQISQKKDLILDDSSAFILIINDVLKEYLSAIETGFGV